MDIKELDKLNAACQRVEVGGAAVFNEVAADLGTDVAMALVVFELRRRAGRRFKQSEQAMLHIRQEICNDLRSCNLLT